MSGSRSDSLWELYLCLSSRFICATVSTGVSQYMAACIEEGDGDDELDRFEEELMVVSLSGARSPEQSCICRMRCSFLCSYF